VGGEAESAVVAVLRERIAAAADRVLRDCIALGAPTPEFIVRVGREAVERFDARYPQLTGGIVERQDPAGVVVNVSIPPDLSSVTVSCRLDHTVEDICLKLADAVQLLLVEGELWGAAWPSCPVHGGSHPVWPEPANGTPVWACSKPPGFVTPIGTFSQATTDG
jgi:hypothetical protein